MSLNGEALLCAVNAERIRRGLSWRDVARATLKAWADPKAWEGLVTTGDPCVAP